MTFLLFKDLIIFRTIAYYVPESPQKDGYERRSKMPNSITILVLRRRCLVENKAQLKRDYEEAAREIDKEISRIDEALKTIEKTVAPYKCKACGGTGQRTGVDAAGSREEYPCKKCRGTGYDMSMS